MLVSNYNSSYEDTFIITAVFYHIVIHHHLSIYTAASTYEGVIVVDEYINNLLITTLQCVINPLLNVYLVLINTKWGWVEVKFCLIHFSSIFLSKHFKE